jgi:hypothetical protein
MPQLRRNREADVLEPLLALVVPVQAVNPGMLFVIWPARRLIVLKSSSDVTEADNRGSVFATKPPVSA